MNRKNLDGQYIKIIRNEWFKWHKTNINKVNEDITIIEFDNGTSYYYVKIIMDNNLVIITGDIGEAIYKLTEKSSIESIAKYDIAYFSSKLTTMSRGKDDWCDRIAYSDLKYWAIQKYRDCDCDEQKENINKAYKVLKNILPNVASLKEWQFKLNEDKVYEVIDKIESYYDSEIWEFGEISSIESYAYYEMFKIMNEQLGGVKE
ncbi:MAG: hypothetical protein PHP92_05170 [Candidatus Nanoarchaeia archaeon]|nr:hypothetical protein [Candidatus Nanoarchaeia archaeon]